MKRFIIVLSVCAVASLAWASSGFSWETYDGGCGACHGGSADVHPDHSALDCTTCHTDGFVPPPTETCAGCHAPGGDPIECPLVIGHDDADVLSCLGCHSACDEPPAGCETDDDCDDGVFCNGIESCSLEASDTSGVCVAGSDPCTGDTPECIEEGTGTCVECIDDADCDEGATCEDDVCVGGGGCPEGTPDEVLLFDTDGDCLLNKEELKNYKNTLKIAQKAEKTELKAKHSLEKDKYKAIKVNFSTK